MEITENKHKVVNTIQSFFPKQHKKIRRNIAMCAYSILRSEKVNTAEIARHMGEINGQDFKSNDMRVYRLLQSKNFQVSDSMWRSHIQLLFTLLKEGGLKKGAEISINVDYTTDRDDFLILCASIVFQEESIPVYFSLRKYPKRSGMMDQKKMETAFFKELRHLLPDSYRYVVVADRGFGNNRIFEILENTKFGYVIRLNDNLGIHYKNKDTNLSELPHQDIRIKSTFVRSWKRSLRIVKKVKEDAHWLLAVSTGIQNPVQKYENRFSIEKMFKNKKSGGFDLEKVFVNKYDRFKRLLFISCVAYAILVFTGLFIRNKAHHIKKNYFLHLDLLSVFSG